MLIGSGTLTSNTSTSAIIHTGGEFFAAISGTWGGGTATLEISYDQGVTFVTLGTDAVKTADATFRVQAPDCQLRFTLTGATSPSLKWSLSKRVPQ